MSCERCKKLEAALKVEVTKQLEQLKLFSFFEGQMATDVKADVAKEKAHLEEVLKLVS